MVFGIRETAWWETGKELEIVYPPNNPKGIHSVKVNKNSLYKTMLEIAEEVNNEWDEACLFEMD